LASPGNVRFFASEPETWATIAVPGPRWSLKRFDIVVFNHQRLDSWFRNAHRIQGFSPTLDRITIVSCSPSGEETRLVRAFEAERGFPVRYLVRENRGIDQLARIDYFTGKVGARADNLAYEFIFQMQDHYLDTESTFSRWGRQYNHRVKGDVVPDGTVFDLPRLYQTLTEHQLAGAFCDRNNPCWFTLGSRRYIAPNGGNFIVRTSYVRDPRVYRLCQSLRAVCDNSYAWAVYVEFMWGVMFFQEGQKFYDVKRERVFSRWEAEQFYCAPDNFVNLHARYHPGLRGRLRRHRSRVRTWGTECLQRLRLVVRGVDQHD
jgi:hypothetical protein